jgi:hypothetical protein
MAGKHGLERHNFEPLLSLKLQLTAKQSAFDNLFRKMSLGNSLLCEDSSFWMRYSDVSHAALL